MNVGKKYEGIIDFKLSGYKNFAKSGEGSEKKSDLKFVQGVPLMLEAKNHWSLKNLGESYMGVFLRCPYQGTGSFFNQR